MTFTEELIREIEQAHMAGQIDAGVDPSYSNAQAYVRELTRPQPEFRKGEIAIVINGLGDRVPIISGNAGYIQKGKLKLRLSEMPEAVEQLRDALERIASQEFNITNDAAGDFAKTVIADFDWEISE